LVIFTLISEELNQNWDIIILGEIFREEKRQMFIKRLIRQVRKEFISNDFKRLIHYKEILMNLDQITNLESPHELAKKIHREMKTNFYKLQKNQTHADNGSIYNVPPLSPNFQSKEFRFESSIMNLSNTLGLNTQHGNLLSTFENDPKIFLEQKKQMLISIFEDNFCYYQNRYIKSQGACLHFLNTLNLQKRFTKLLKYNFRFASEVPKNLGISYYDPIIRDNIILTFFPKGTQIPTKRVAKDFHTKSEVIKLKILEGDSFLSDNCRCIEEFEIKLMDVIDECDGFRIKMTIDHKSILNIGIFNKNKCLFEIQLLYKVRYCLFLN
jgi:hypothetical protein